MVFAIKWRFRVPLVSEKSIDSEVLVPLLHSFIQEKRLEGTLIDVADYTHLRDGPGVLLVAHEALYGIDSLQGEQGFYVHLRRLPSAGGARGDLLSGLNLFFKAATIFAQAPVLSALGRLDTRRLEVALGDRLIAPNATSAREKFGPLIEKTLAEVYAVPIEVDYPQRLDQLFGVVAQTQAEVALETLLHKTQEQIAHAA